MKFLRLNVSAVLALAAAGVGDIAHAQCSGYSVDFLSGPDCQLENSSATAHAINDAGELCGGYYTCDKSADSAVWLGVGPWIPVTSVPPGFVGFGPHDINASRQMAGITAPSQNPNATLAALYDFDSKAMISLGALPGHNWAEAYAINDQGVVVGASNNTATGPLAAFVWQDEVMFPIPISFGTDSEALDISDTGKICGWMGTDIADDSHAFVYDSTSRETLDIGKVFAGSSGSRATGVNNSGAICGWSFIPCGFTCYERRGFIWNNGVAQDLGVVVGTTKTEPQAINDSETVVGYCWDPGASKAFVWQNGMIQALNDLIPIESNLDIRNAWDISNAGQIVGDAHIVGTGDRVAVRLTPIPSPVGDINCDSMINVDDLLGVINHWADENPKGSNALPQGDFTHDGIVDFQDLMIVIDNWTS